MGTLNNSQTCDQQTGNCFCKQNIEGEKCNVCKNGFYLFPTDQESDCLECPCDVGGAYEICEKQTGNSTVLFIVTFEFLFKNLLHAVNGQLGQLNYS